MELRDVLRALAADGVAVLISSHILSELEEIADRVVLVAAGATVSEYTMAELGNAARVGYRVRATDGVALSAALAARGVLRGPVAAASVEAPSAEAPSVEAPSAEAPSAEAAGADTAEAKAAEVDAAGAETVAAGAVVALPGAVSRTVDLPPMSEDEAADLLAGLVGAGVRVVAYEPVHSALESAYLAMTEDRR
jgi:ABC-2 type transport system ATP-binding protein